MEHWGKGERRRYLEGYTWSSYRGYVDERRREEFVSYELLKTLSENPRQARRRYRGYVWACLMEEDGALRELMGQSGYGIGSEEFVKELERELRARKSGTERDRDVAYPEEKVLSDRIDEVVARAYGTTAAALRAHGHNKGAGLAKAVALELACRLTGRTQREIGSRYGGISSQAVSLARKRAKSLVSSEELSKLTDRIRT